MAVEHPHLMWVEPSSAARPSVPDWARIRQQVFLRDDFTCAYCRQRGGRLECDHIHPVALGGGQELENLTTACFDCNRSKRAKTVEEWLLEAVDA